MPERNGGGVGLVSFLTLLEPNGTLWLQKGSLLCEENGKVIHTSTKGQSFVRFIESALKFFEHHLRAPKLEVTMGKVGLENSYMTLPTGERFSEECHDDIVATTPVVIDDYEKSVNEYVDPFLDLFWAAYGEETPKAY